MTKYIFDKYNPTEFKSIISYVIACHIFIRNCFLLKSIKDSFVVKTFNRINTFAPIQKKKTVAPILPDVITVFFYHPISYVQLSSHLNLTCMSDNIN